MKSKIVEAEWEGLWLKVIVAVLSDEEIGRPSYHPDNVEHAPGRALLQLERKTEPDDIWILDLSTREGAAFSSWADPTYAVHRVKAEL